MPFAPSISESAGRAEVTGREVLRARDFDNFPDSRAGSLPIR